ncbi:hypothetical protein [Nonomuraea sp. NPDC005730]
MSGLSPGEIGGQQVEQRLTPYALLQRERVGQGRQLVVAEPP